MSRRTNAPVREVLPDSVYNSVTVEKFINRMMLDGKKSVSTRILYDAMKIMGEKTGESALDVFTKALDIRRSGSAALDLCAVAAGRAELYFELNLQPWDYAAGSGGFLIESLKYLFNKIEKLLFEYISIISCFKRGRNCLFKWQRCQS